MRDSIKMRRLYNNSIASGLFIHFWLLIVVNDGADVFVI